MLVSNTEVINIIDFAMILWSGWEFMCSSRRVDSWWNCTHLTDGCGKETWYSFYLH